MNIDKTFRFFYKLVYLPMVCFEKLMLWSHCLDHAHSTAMPLYNATKKKILLNNEMTKSKFYMRHINQNISNQSFLVIQSGQRVTARQKGGKFK